MSGYTFETQGKRTVGAICLLLGIELTGVVVSGRFPVFGGVMVGFGCGAIIYRSIGEWLESQFTE